MRTSRYSDGSREVLGEEAPEPSTAAAKWRMQRERNSPGEATHLAITFRLTEAYPGAGSGAVHALPLHSQRLAASV